MNSHWNACDCHRPLSRREMLRSSAAGFASLALAGLLADEAQRARRSAGARAAALHAQGQAGDLPVHARRPVAGRHVRLQAAVGTRPRQAAALRQAARRLGRNGQPAALALEVPATRPKRRLGQRAVPAHGRHRRRDVLPPFDARLEQPARRRIARAAHRQRHVRPPQHGLVDHLRPGHRESRPARLRHHLPHAHARRREQLQLGLPARHLPGHAAGQRRHPVGSGQDPLHRKRSDAPPRTAPRARSAGRDERRASEPLGPRHGAGGPHRLVRAGLPHAGRRAAIAGHLRRDRPPRWPSMAWTIPRPPTSAASA